MRSAKSSASSRTITSLSLNWAWVRGLRLASDPRHLQDLWDVGGAAAAGAGVAKTLLAASGPLAAFGVAASTPVGWLFGAALVSGSTYYGVMRMIKGAQRNRVT